MYSATHRNKQSKKNYKERTNLLETIYRDNSENVKGEMRIL